MGFNGEVTYCSTQTLELPLFHLYLERCKSRSHTVLEITCSFSLEFKTLSKCFFLPFIRRERT